MPELLKLRARRKQRPMPSGKLPQNGAANPENQCSLPHCFHNRFLTLCLVHVVGSNLFAAFWVPLWMAISEGRILSSTTCVKSRETELIRLG